MNALVAAGLSIVLVSVAGGARADGDAARGERLFNQQCKACHTLDKGGPNTVGPNLYGLFGRKAGSAPYAYSDAMKGSGIVWDDKTLSEYLKDPKAKVPGTKMTYIGLRQEPQREDMTAFLKKATQ
jgi:cytochrome c